MIYNLSSPLDAHNACTRLSMLIKRGAVAELTEKKPKRTLAQNAYLHLCLGYFASQTGNTLAWVKKYYYKCHCNRELFIREKQDELLHRAVKFMRSSADLTTEEMSDSIERFRNWAASEAGIYIPDATREEEIQAMQIEVERYKQYI